MVVRQGVKHKGKIIKKVKKNKICEENSFD